MIAVGCFLEGDRMKVIYLLFTLLLAVVAIFTREVVTFIMLGFILLALNNIQDTLREISRKLGNTSKLDQETVGGNHER